MRPLIQIIWICLSFHLVNSIRTVMVMNQSEPVLVMEGRTVRLSCSINKPWFFCLWDTPAANNKVSNNRIPCLYFDKIFDISRMWNVLSNTINLREYVTRVTRPNS